MMLRNVVVDYLQQISERELDLPFISLLLAEGYTNVHLTHGTAEYGKDFIAQRVGQTGVVEQWCFQSKAGDIGQSDWREVMPQLLEAATVGVSHTAFSADIPRRIVLVLTGRMKGNAPISSQSFSDQTLVRRLRGEPLETWDIDILVDKFVRSAPSAFAPQRSGSFHKLYGEALRSETSMSKVEVHSRNWNATESAMTPFEIVFEALLLASAYRTSGLRYQEFQCMLAMIRSLLVMSFENRSPQVDSLMTLAVTATERAAVGVVEEVESQWRASGCDLVSSGISLDPVGYIVICLRVAEAAGYLALTSRDPDARIAKVAFLVDWISHEKGTAHPLSDNYAVTVAWMTLALVAHGRQDIAKSLVERTAVWVCDRYDDEGCLAAVHAAASEEVRTLLGQPYQFMSVAKRRQSFVACVLGDLAATIGDAQLYELVINDMKAVGIVPQCWQCADTLQQFNIVGNEMVQVVDASFSDNLIDPHAEHTRSETRSFRLATTYGVAPYVGLSLLLRDRYFPGLWNRTMAAASCSSALQE